MKEFVEENRLGITVKSEDNQAFAEDVIKILNGDFVIFKNKKQNEWYWEETVKPLITDKAFNL